MVSILDISITYLYLFQRVMMDGTGKEIAEPKNIFLLVPEESEKQS